MQKIMKMNKYNFKEFDIAYNAYDGNVTRLAEEFKKTRPTIYNWIKSYNRDLELIQPYKSKIFRLEQRIRELKSNET